MYKRVEHIEEENLDWDQQSKRLIEEKPVQAENVIYAPALQSKKTFWQSIIEFDMQKVVVDIFNKNMEIVSFMGVLLLPYFVGFLFAYVLFFSYGNLTIMEFITMGKEYLLLELWSIGAYLFVTSWVFWAFSQIAQNRKQLLTLSHR